MSADELASFWVHHLSVRTYQGTNGSGDPILSDPVDVPCFISARRRYIRNTAGDQVVSESSASADPSYAATFRDASVVTFDDGTTSTVISVAVSTSGPLDLPDRVKAYFE